MGFINYAGISFENQLNYNRDVRETKRLSKFIGRTLLKLLDNEKLNLSAKLEYNNFTGSAKDRVAYSIIEHGIVAVQIDESTTIIASSSGNFAISIALITLISKI
jgi:cysteine synthase